MEEELMQIFTLTNESDHGQQEKRENGVIFLSCDLLDKKVVKILH